MSTRPGRPDPLEKTGEPRWLVVRDRMSRALEFRMLPGGSDLRAAIGAKQAELAKTGWRVDSIARKCAFFFADRDNDRVCVSVECFEPETAADVRRFRR
jgi:hypothetical protein